MQELKGFQNANKESFERGATVGQEGNIYNILDFQSCADYLDKYKLAASLSKQCRYVGNVGGFYSVAQHCVMMAQAAILIGDPVLAKECLYHECDEAIKGDTPMPTKRVFQENNGLIKTIEDGIMAACAVKFGVPFPHTEALKTLDRNAAQYEMTVMMGNAIFIDYWKPKKAYRMFMNMIDQVDDLIDILEQSKTNDSNEAEK